MPFGSLLSLWIGIFGEGDCSAENLEEVIENIERFDELTEEEKQNAIDRLVITINAFEKVWNEYIYSDIYKSMQYRFCGLDYLAYKVGEYNKYTYTLYAGEGYTSYDNSYFFIPPKMDYELSHFVDQDGQIYKLGDPITKDMVLTPVYVNSFKSKDNLITINIETEDNSNEEFEIDVYREADKLIYNELNDKSTYIFNEDDWTIDENGTIISFDVDPGKIEEKYKKIIKTVHIPATEESEEQDITYETGLIPIGIPEKINGITVKGISSDAFLDYKNKYMEEFQGHSGESEVDYFDENWICIYLPKTLETFGSSNWLTNIKDEIKEEIDILKEQGYNLVCTDCLSGIAEGIDICPQCEGTEFASIDTMNVDVTIGEDTNIILPPTIYMPTTYMVADPDNINFTTIHGSLYNKDVTKLYYLSYLSQMQSLELGNWDYYKPLWDFHNTILGTDGLEIPCTVVDMSYFALNSPYGEMAMHYYGNALNYEDINLKAKISVILYYGEGQSKIYTEGEYGTILSSMLNNTNGCFILDKKNIPLVNYFCDMYKNMYGVEEFKWVPDYTGIYSILESDDYSTGIVYLEDGNREKINVSGTISTDDPFEVYLYSKGILKYEEPEKRELGDPFVRTIRFRSLPDRYIKPSQEELKFSLDDKEKGVTIKLMLKKGNISAKTTDEEGNEIPATYNIVNESGEVVGELSSSDGRIVTSDKLVYGKYKIVPQTIKEGYNLPLEKEFEITEDGQVIEIEFKAEKKEEPENPEPEDPGTEKPEPEDPGTENPEPENPEPEDPGTENPGTENPEPEDPEPQNPTPDEPKKEDSKPQDTEKPKTETKNTIIENENMATSKMPYTGIVIKNLIIIVIIGGLGLTVFAAIKIYKNI